MKSTAVQKMYPTAVRLHLPARPFHTRIRNECHGRLQFASVRGELVWLFVPRSA